MNKRKQKIINKHEGLPLSVHGIKGSFVFFDEEEVGSALPIEWWNKLSSMVDDSTTMVAVPTPKGWRCKKKGCPTKFKHIHSTFRDWLWETMNGLPKGTIKHATRKTKRSRLDK